MKKKFTVYGNCQSTILAACLKQVKSFNDTYQYFRLPFCHRITVKEYNSLSSQLDGIDLIITQPVSSQYRGGGFDSNHLVHLAKNSIGFPSLQFYGYFPSLTRFNIPKISSEITSKINNCLLPYSPLTRDSLYHYNEIKMMTLEKYPTSMICQRFDLGSSQEFSLEKCLKWTLSHLKDKESKFNLIPISDYLESNWQQELLFYTPRHPSGFVMAELVKRICDNLHLPVYEHELKKIILKDHFSHIKLYIPQWIRKNYLSCIKHIEHESFYTLNAADTVSLYTNLYRLMPSTLHA